MRRLAVAATVVAVVAAGALVLLLRWPDASQSAPPRAAEKGLQLVVALPQPRRSGAGMRVTGGKADQRRLLREIVARLAGDLRVRGVEIGAAPSRRWRPSPSLLAFGRTWLYVDLSGGLGETADSEAAWQAELLAGAFRDLSHDRGLPDLLGFSTRTHVAGQPARVREEFITGAPMRSIGPASVLRRRLLGRRIAEKVRAELREAHRAAGGRIRARLEFAGPTTIAPVLTVAATRPRGVAKYFLRHDPVAGGDGFFFVIRSTGGDTELGAARAAALRMSMVWGASDLIDPLSSVG